MVQKTVVITGCDVPHSYGYELALRLDRLDFAVFAGCSDANSGGARALASRGSPSLAVVPLDVMKQDDIDDVVQMIDESVGTEGVWALVNCAEHYSVAEVDWNSIDDYERSMQVNYMGTIRMTKSLLHLIRRARGRIVNLSSIAGSVARVGQSSFAASKFAIEAFSDSLRQEMIKWGVFVILIQPAYYPAGTSLMVESNLSVRLKMVPQETRDLYGDDYFVDFVNSVSDTANSQSSSKSRSNSFQNAESSSNNDESPSKSGESSSGYSSLSSSLKSGIKSDEKEKLLRSSLEKASYNDNSLKRSIPNLSNTNRVLHALVDACSSSSPKVRYFVGTFHDRMIKSMSNILPTVIMDTYLTSGQMSKVIPKILKEKMD